MFKHIVAGLLMYLWNWMIDFQKPITYSETETHNDYKLKINRTDCTQIIVVKQLRLVRKPSRLFKKKVAYLYDVTQYTFIDGKNCAIKSNRYPEYCWSLFRITKIPHLMAMNAFLYTTY